MKVPKEIIDLFEQKQSFIAHAHLGPDADSVGSILALKLGLESIGKVVHLYCEDELMSNLSFLPGINSIQKTDMASALTLNHDVYISLDTAKWSLATHSQPAIMPSCPVINIDHHPDSTIHAQYSWIKTQAACSTQLVYELLKALKIVITPDIATCILAGILSDTGTFQNTNTNDQIIRLTIRLRRIGADYNRCVIEIARSIQFEELKVWMILLKNLQLSPDNSFVWTTLNHEEWRACNTKASLGGFANAILARVMGTKFGAILTEKEKGVTKGSLRSRYLDMNIAQIAQCLGGGGHTASAGFRIEKSLASAEKDFLSVVNRLKALNKL